MGQPLTEDCDLDLTEKTFKFKIAGEPHIIVEADGETATQFQSKILSGVTMTEGKIEGMAGMALGQLYLISRCLKKLDAVGTRHDIPMEVIKALPSRITKPIYDKIREISDLIEDDPAKTKAKNA